MAITPDSRTTHAGWHWLWGGMALAVGLFISGHSWAARLAGPAITVVALMGLTARARWAHTSLWIGLGMTLGTLGHVLLTLAQPGTSTLY